MANLFTFYFGATENSISSLAYTLAALALDQQSMRQVEQVLHHTFVRTVHAVLNLYHSCVHEVVSTVPKVNCVAVLSVVCGMAASNCCSHNTHTRAASECGKLTCA